MIPDPLPESSQDLKVTLTKERRFRHFRMLEELLATFRPSERLLLYVFTVVLGFSSLVLLAGANAAVSVTVPSEGGSLIEGEIGPARFVNPLLTLSQADLDLTTLVFSGLTRSLPDGTVVPDLADRYEISPDGLTYTFTLRDGVEFHDGTPVTSADVLFTITKAQDPEIKSVHRADWEGVVVSTPDPKTVVFKLPRAYAPFLHNTTMGILPEHLWKDVTAEEFPFSPLNTNPVGTGPYEVRKVSTDSTGAVSRYELVPFSGFALGKPYIRRITFVFFPNEAEMIKGFEQGRVNAVAGIAPERLGSITRTDSSVLTVALPRTFGVFFNQSHSPVFTDAAARKALDASIDKEALVANVLHGYGVPLEGPILPELIGGTTATGTHETAASAQAYTDASIADARGILEKGGWAFDETAGVWKKGGQQLSFTLATADTPELKATADAVAAAWRALGASVAVQVYSVSELNTNVIRPRQYDAILFGEIVGRELDLFAFWHSSQRNDPGLNLALYANSRADAILTEGRATTDDDERSALYRQFDTIIRSDMPAVFLYAPEFIYIVPEGLKGVSLASLTTPGERFLDVYRWYADTERVWGFFAKDGHTIL